jgi:hypothetical protein
MNKLLIAMSVMTAIIIERETNNYWELIKNVSTEVKLALISRLSNSIISEVAENKDAANRLIDDILRNAPKNASITEEDILQEIKSVRV